jgi:hypothetical protein
MVLAIRLSVRTVREKVGSKNLRIQRIHSGIRKKIDRDHARDPLIVKAHISPMRVLLRQLMQTRFLVSLHPMPTIRWSLLMKLGHDRQRVIKNLYGAI